MSTDTRRVAPRTVRKIRTLAVCAVAAVASLTLAVPASAMPVGDGVRVGKNITVFGNLDFVATFGHPVGQKLTVDVYRGDTRIATAFGPAASTPEGGGLEVNHGVEGNVAQGDCWENFTPDVRPGDRIVVTDSSGGTDQVLVDNITISGPPQLDLSTTDPSDIIVQGTATYADGEPIPTNLLDSAEMRLGSTFRATPSEIVGDGEGAWRATYRQNASGQYNWFRNEGLSSEQQKQAILDGDHAMGYGHIEPLPVEAQLVDGLGTGGPAPGCGASAPDAPASAMGVVSPKTITQANEGGSVSVSGVIQDGVDVALQLNGADLPALPPDSINRTNGTWSTQIPAAAFREGTNEVKAIFTGPNVPGPQTAKVEKDTTPPAAATANPKPDLYNTDKLVTLGVSEPAARIRYTTDGTDPSGTTGTLYSGEEIPVTTNTTIRTVTVDAVGNVGAVTPLEYRIDKVAPGLPTSDLASGSYDSAQQMSLASDAADLKEIRYTVGQGNNVPADPTAKSGQVYTDPVNVAGTQTVKAVAIDTAGNASRVLERTITIRTATRTTLEMATTKLKIRKNRTIQGSVLPPGQAGGAVVVTIDRPGALSTITKRDTLDDFSRYSLAYRPTAVGTYKVKAAFVKDDDALDSTSVVKSFRVVR